MPRTAEQNRLWQANFRARERARSDKAQLIEEFGERAYDKMTDVQRNNHIIDLGSNYTKARSSERLGREHKKKVREAKAAQPHELKVAGLTRAVEKLVIKNNRKIKAAITSPPETKLELKTLGKDLKKHQLEVIAHKNCQDLIDRILEHNKRLPEKKQPLPATIKANINKIKFLYENQYDEKFDCKDFSRYLQYNKTDKWLKEFRKDKALNTIKQDYSALGAILKHFGEDYRAAQKFYIDAGSALDVLYKEERKHNRLTEKQKKKLNTSRGPGVNILTLKQFQARGGTKIKNKKDRALYGLMSEIPPRRAGVFAKMVIKPPDFDEDKMRGINYITVDEKNKPLFIVLNSYKTVKKYKRFKLDLANYSKFQSSIRMYLNSTIFSYDSVLFPTPTGLIYGSGNFTNKLLNPVLQKYSKTRMTSKDARNIYVSEKIKNANTEHKKEKIASLLGHSADEFRRYAKVE